MTDVPVKILSRVDVFYKVLRAHPEYLSSAFVYDCPHCCGEGAIYTKINLSSTESRTYSQECPTCDPTRNGNTVPKGKFRGGPRYLEMMAEMAKWCNCENMSVTKRLNEERERWRLNTRLYEDGEHIGCIPGSHRHCLTCGLICRPHWSG